MKGLIQQHDIVTSHGALAVEERGEGKISVLLIHGNSSCRGVFPRATGVFAYGEIPV